VSDTKDSRSYVSLNISRSAPQGNTKVRLGVYTTVLTMLWVLPGFEEPGIWSSSSKFHAEETRWIQKDAPLCDTCSKQQVHRIMLCSTANLTVSADVESRNPTCSSNKLEYQDRHARTGTTFVLLALTSQIQRLREHHAMKTYGWVKVQPHALLTSAGEWSASRPGRFTSGSVGPRAEIQSKRLVGKCDAIRRWHCDSEAAPVTLTWARPPGSRDLTGSGRM
jgi:hypothetical protein